MKVFPTAAARANQPLHHSTRAEAPWFDATGIMMRRPIGVLGVPMSVRSRKPALTWEGQCGKRFSSFFGPRTLRIEARGSLGC